LIKKLLQDVIDLLIQALTFYHIALSVVSKPFPQLVKVFKERCKSTILKLDEIIDLIEKDSETSPSKYINSKIDSLVSVKSIFLNRVFICVCILD
jgi:hypothetical protein